MNFITKNLSTLSFILSLSTVGAADVFVDFENSTDVNLFTPNNGNVGYTYGATNGVNGTGGIAVSDNGPVWGYNGESYDLSALPQLTIRLDAKYVVGTEIHNRVGVLASVGESFSSNIYVDFVDDKVQFRISGINASTQTISWTGTNWSRLEFTLKDNGSNWGLSASLFDLGSDGNDTPIQVGSTITTTTSASIFGDTSIFAAMKLDTGASNFDNFAVTTVPEPSTMLLMGLTGLAMAQLLRRRR